MLTALVAVPLLGALVLAVTPGIGERTAKRVSIAVAAVPVVLTGVVLAAFQLGGPKFQQVADVDWIPTLGVGWRVGVDGISLALVAVTAVLFLAVVAYPEDTRGMGRQYHAWMLFLEAVSLGLFVTLDLVVFYVFFDLSLVGMYFLVSRWGHDDAERAALKFFLYTLLGSLVLLLGILALGLSMDPITFDMRAIIVEQPLAGAAPAGLVLLALLVGLGIKTPVVPFHTWLPAAHVEAPATGSAILAGVLLKMGTYGLVRIPLEMMAVTFQRYALWIGIVGVVSILYGALVAFGQGDLKRRIAYTSVNHMGYSVLGIAAAGGLLAGNESARSLALTGATVEMVAHGLITGALFLLTGSVWRRTQEYDIDAYGGISSAVPAMTAATTVAAFASLGLPGLLGFVAEFQVFVGTFAVYPVLAAVGLLGILVTAALFLQLLQRMFFGERTSRFPDLPDLGGTEKLVLGGLLGLVVLFGVAPRPLLDLVQTATTVVVGG